MARVRIVGKRHANERCAICHGALREQHVACKACGTEMHRDCRRELSRCPTLGCAEQEVSDGRGARAAMEPPAPHGPPSLGARLGPYSHLAESALILVGLVVLCGVILVQPVFYWRARASGWDLANVGAAAITILLACGVGGAALQWLWRIPGVAREVRRLLDETEPVPMTLRVSVGGESYVAHLEAEGSASISLDLTGYLPPRWLRELRGTRRVYVYGHGPGGPYVMELPDGRLALVQP